MKMISKTVSVVIATHNGSHYIEELLLSVIGQNFPPAEIIISDDASTDNTLEIVERITAGCGIETRILRNTKPLGFRDNFLRSSLTAQGDFIAFCDQDDIWDKTKLEKCARFFEDINISMIVHSATTIDKDANEIGSFRQGIRRTTIRPPLSYDPWFTFFGFSILFRRDLLGLADINSRFVDYIVPTEMIAHDRWITFLAQMVGSTAEIEQPLVGYRQHESNVFGDGSRKPVFTKRDVESESRNYIAATSRMMEIIKGIPEDSSEIFPQFSREKCIVFLKRALEQLKARDEIYRSSSRMKSLAYISKLIVSGKYKAVHNNRNRWRSIARDTTFALLRV